MGGFSGGVYSRFHDWEADRVAGLDITDTRMDAEDDGFAAALSMCILKDGSQTVTADIPMNGHRLTGLADPLGATHAMTQGAGDIRYARADAPATISGALTVTSSSANALWVGPPGVNSTFNVYSAAANAVTGINIIGQAAGAGIYIDATSTAANEPMYFRAKGNGTINFWGGCAYMPAVDGSQGADALQSICVSSKASPSSGDGQLASVGFLCPGAYGVKLSLRGDGVFGVGGWSATPWKWYVSLGTGLMTCLGGANFGGGGIAMGGSLSMTSTAFSIIFADTDWGTRTYHCNQGQTGLIRGDFSNWLYYMDATEVFRTVSSIVAGGNVQAYSDARAKTDIRTISNALERVRNMRGVWFKQKDSGEDNSGVLAQELQAVAPELVSEGPDGKLAVAYGNIVAYLIEAVKELTDMVEARA